MASSIPDTPGSYAMPLQAHDDTPIIDDAEPFAQVVEKVASYITGAINSAYTYEQLRISHILKPLISTLIEDCHHVAIVAALLYAFEFLPRVPIAD